MSLGARARPPVDALVVGSGAAGMRVALEAVPLTIAIVTKTAGLRGGASPMARGGIAAAVGPGDGPARHEADTLAAAAGLAVKPAVRALVRAGPATIDRLARLGTRFDRDARGGFALAREAAHACARIVHAADATGEELIRALVAAIESEPRIAVRAATFVENLIVEGGRITGVTARAADGSREIHPARAVILATGGIGHAFAATTNPREATGDGLAMAARAGALLADLEFVQFHPTALDVDVDPRPLLTEALRGAGARLVDAGGAPLFLPDGSAAELAPRDVVAAWLARRSAAADRTYLDARSLNPEALRRVFPSAYAACAAAGLDLSREPVPVAPAAHYHMGGVATDCFGRTSLPGLWACGEVACTGAHGANRLASNSLLEALAFGAFVADDVLRALGSGSAPPQERRAAPDGRGIARDAPWTPPPREAARLRATISDGLGLERHARGLIRLLERVPEIAPEGTPGELANMALVARLIASAALLREESRGAHRRADFPREATWLAFRRLETAAGLLALARSPVSSTR